MIDVSDDGHVADVVLLVHDRTDLVYGKVHLDRKTTCIIGNCCITSKKGVSYSDINQNHIIVHSFSEQVCVIKIIICTFNC